MLSAVEKKSDQVYRWLLAYIDENKFSKLQKKMIYPKFQNC